MKCRSRPRKILRALGSRRKANRRGLTQGFSVCAVSRTTASADAMARRRWLTTNDVVRDKSKRAKNVWGHMLRLPEFHLPMAPQSLSEALAMLAADPQNTSVLAGGTDLLPNMKGGNRHQPGC